MNNKLYVLIREYSNGIVKDSENAEYGEKEFMGIFTSPDKAENALYDLINISRFKINSKMIFEEGKDFNNDKCKKVISYEVDDRNKSKKMIFGMITLFIIVLMK